MRTKFGGLTSVTDFNLRDILSGAFPFLFGSSVQKSNTKAIRRKNANGANLFNMGIQSLLLNRFFCAVICR